MDWALIESPNTFSPNRPPPWSALYHSIFRQSLDISYCQNEDSEIKRFGEVKPGEWVAKMGRNDSTAGTVNPIEREVQWAPGVTSRESEIISDYGPIAASGDAGSITTNAQGELVGLLFAIGTCKKYNSGFMTTYCSYSATCRGDD
jgi:hypothetical protein